MYGVLREARALAKLLVSGGRFKPTVLMYHSIGRNAAHATVTPEEFAAQMAFLHDHGFSVIPLDECVRRAREGESGKLVSLTFDDGYADFATEAAPVLKRNGWSATVFLITGKMSGALGVSGGGSIPLLTWAQARELSQQGFAFGSHTVTHPKLDTLQTEAARHELLDSKPAIERELGAKCDWLCYPKGRNSTETRRLAQEAGYVGAVTVEKGHPSTNDDMFGIPRAYVHSEMGSREFEACLL